MAEEPSALPWSINKDDYELQEVIGKRSSGLGVCGVPLGSGGVSPLREGGPAPLSCGGSCHTPRKGMGACGFPLPQPCASVRGFVLPGELCEGLGYPSAEGDLPPTVWDVRVWGAPQLGGVRSHRTHPVTDWDCVTTPPSATYVQRMREALSPRLAGDSEVCEGLWDPPAEAAAPPRLCVGLTEGAAGLPQPRRGLWWWRGRPRGWGLLPGLCPLLWAGSVSPRVGVSGTGSALWGAFLPTTVWSGMCWA